MEIKVYKNKPLSIILLVSIITYLIFASCIVVKATIPSSQLVTSYNATWDSISWGYTSTNKYYKVSNSSNIPVSTQSSYKCFYTMDNITFHVEELKPFFIAALNYKVGLIYKPSQLDILYNGFITDISIKDSNNKYIQNGLYDNNDNFLGFVLNDITGCYYSSDELEAIQDDGTYAVNVKNYHDYTVNNSSLDFFTFYPPENSEVTTHFVENNPTMATNQKNEILLHDNSFKLFYYLDQSIRKFTTVQVNYNNAGYVDYLTSDYHIVADSTTNFNSFCSFYQMSKSRKLCTFDDLFDTPNGNIKSLNGVFYNDSNTKITNFTRYDATNNTNSVVNLNYSTLPILYRDDGYITCPIGNPITIYSTSTVFDDIKNETYENDFYTTDTYNNFDPQSDNTVTISKNILDNSITYNQNIYNDSNDVFYESIDNSNVNTENVTNNVTNITNNYYENSSGGGDNPDNPDNPDDNTTLDAILQAILRFFKAIGDIIGTVLAGILNMIDAVLEAIAGITEDLTGISDFFSSMLGWLPEPIPTVIGVGISLCIIAGIVKFIRG